MHTLRSIMHMEVGQPGATNTHTHTHTQMHTHAHTCTHMNTLSSIMHMEVGQPGTGAPAAVRALAIDNLGDDPEVPFLGYTQVGRD